MAVGGIGGNVGLMGDRRWWLMVVLIGVEVVLLGHSGCSSMGSQSCAPDSSGLSVVELEMELKQRC